MVSSNENVALARLLARTARELEAAGAFVESMNSLVDIAISHGASSEAFFHDAQSIDILKQHLLELASFVREIAQEAEADWSISCHSAVGNIKLSGLRERLAHCHLPSESEEVAHGAMQLF